MYCGVYRYQRPEFLSANQIHQIGDLPLFQPSDHCHEIDSAERSDPKTSSAKMSTITSYASKDGSFKRKQSRFRDFISSEEGAQFPPEKDRYHLYVSYACPWGIPGIVF